MTLDQAFVEIESDKVRIACASASHVVSAIEAVKISEGYRYFKARMLFPNVASSVVARVEMLVANAEPAAERNQGDEAILAYLMLLKFYSSTVAVRLAGRISVMRDLWWSRQFAGSLCELYSSGNWFDIQRRNAETTGVPRQDGSREYQLAMTSSVLFYSIPATAA